MHWIPYGSALLLAVAIIVLGALYIVSPLANTRTFGLPLPSGDANTAWWLRLKGVRDIVSGLNVLAFMVWGSPSQAGLILLVEAGIPIGDMLTILAAKGSTKAAFGMHGVTALVMILTAGALLLEVQ